MFKRERSSTGGRRGLIATATAAVFATAGVGVLGIAIAAQRRPAQPPRSGSTSGQVVTEGLAMPMLWFNPLVETPRFFEEVASISGPTLTRSKPISLDIPSIDVHSVIQHLGLDPDGALEVPAPGPHYNEAGWYRHSPTPGSLGPAIVMGHIDSAVEGPSVFFRLGELGAGDRVSITREDGSKAIFRVDDVMRYAKDDFPTQVVYNDIDHAGLRLVTCGGAFDNSTGHYLDNIVVFASMVGSREG